MTAKQFTPSPASEMHIKPFMARSLTEAYKHLCARLSVDGPRALSAYTPESPNCSIAASLFDGEDRATDARGRDVTNRVCS